MDYILYMLNGAGYYMTVILYLCYNVSRRQQTEDNAIYANVISACCISCPRGCTDIAQSTALYLTH